MKLITPKKLSSGDKVATISMSWELPVIYPTDTRRVKRD
jgi:hypothetical protein